MRVDFPFGVVDALIEKAKQTPYFHIGKSDDVYMERYWLVKPVDKGAPGVRVHCFKRSDADLTYHDHPFDFTSIILRGHYIELRPVWDDRGCRVSESLTLCGPGDVQVRKFYDFHRVILPMQEDVWTLCMTGPVVQKWGFLCDPMRLHSKMHWKEFNAREGAIPTNYQTSSDDYTFFDSVDAALDEIEGT